MKASGFGRNIVSALLIAVLLFSVVGCGNDGSAKTEYVLRVGGAVYGTQDVYYRREGKKVIYSSTERFPYDFQDTTLYRKLTLSSDLLKVLGYSSNKRVPGASYHTDITLEKGTYTYLEDKLQTFKFVPGLPATREVFPIEADSVCLLQVLLKRFLEADVKQATALTIVPSIGPIIQEVSIERTGKGEILISGASFAGVTIGFDDSGLITYVMNSRTGAEISRGSARRTTSKSYEPSGKGLTVKEIRIEAPDGKELTGSLYFPEGNKPYPAVILSSDFGPQDRTGNGVLSQIAVRLAEYGMAVLTCDKRGIPGSKGDYATYTFNSAKADLGAQVDYLVFRGDIDIDRIGLLGYGEGGALAASVVPSNPYISACVFMATPAVRLFPDLPLLELSNIKVDNQLAQAEVSQNRTQIENLTNLLSSSQENTAEIGRAELFLGWMRSQEVRDPALEFSSVKVPVMVVQGTEDGIVDAAQASQIVEYLKNSGNPDVKLSLYEGLGHYFGPFVMGPPYRKHSKVDPQVLSDISDWFKEKLLK